jgi:hypothetical protein
MSAVVDAIFGSIVAQTAGYAAQPFAVPLARRKARDRSSGFDAVTMPPARGGLP